MKDKPKPFWLLTRFRRDSNKNIHVECQPVRYETGNTIEWVGSETTMPYLLGLQIGGCVYLTGHQSPVWEWFGFDIFMHDSAYNLVANRARLMADTLENLDRKMAQLRSQIGLPANIGQGVQWTVRVTQALGIIIEQEDDTLELYANGEIATRVNQRVDAMQRTLCGKE